MLLGWLITAILGMGTFSFVAPESDGYAIYLAGERVGFERNLVTAQRIYQEQFDAHYTLTREACIRAPEFAAVRQHIRPDGSLFWTVFPPEKRTAVLEIGVWRSGPNVISIMEAIQLWNDMPSHHAIMILPVSEFGLCEVDGAIIVLGRL
jgi:hypothetical protein